MGGSYQLDKRDLKIIAAIADNARLPYSRIGRMTRISKDRVRERLFNLSKELFILSYFPLIDYTKLGYRLFHVFVRLRDISLDTCFYREICRCQSLLAFTSLTGRSDYEIQILARNKDEIKKILENIRIKRRDFQHIVILSSSTFYHYTMQVYPETECLSGRTVQIKNFPLKYIINPLDKRILKALCSDARKSTVSIATETQASEEVVRYRINTLIKKRVIQGFYARTNKHRFGLHSYILLLKLDDISKEKCRELAKKVNIYYIKGCSGKWNLIINFYAENNHHLIKILDLIKKVFGEKLKQSELLILLDRQIFNPFPKVLL